MEVIPLLEHFNMSLIDENDHLLLAVSGGIDSMVLLHYLNTIKNEYQFRISVAHFNHLKREDSQLDQLLVEQTCNSLEIDYYVENLRNEEYDNFHDFARQKRYEFFYQTAKNIGANKIVLAHNQNDNAETVLMRLVRGSSFEGYRGILELSTYRDITIIRPLLSVSRTDILAYQNFNQIEYREDSSNNEDYYTRNRFRHHLLPQLENENPKFLEKIEQFSEYQTKAYILIEKLAKEYINNHLASDENKLYLNIQSYLELEEILQVEVAKRIVNIKTNNNIELSYQNIKDIISLIRNDKPHVELILNDNLYIYKSYDKVFFSSEKQEHEDYQFNITQEQVCKLPDNSLVIITKNPNKYYGIMFKLCYNNLDFILPLTLRNRRNGDKISTDAGTKKLKDVFINKKVPMQKRNILPILLNKENEIIWIPEIFKAKCNGDQYLYIIYQEGKKNA